MRPPGAQFDPGYVVARNILLGALDALAPYGREAIIVVGAQAIYLRCDKGDAILPPFTIDSDFVIDLTQRSSYSPIRSHLEGLGYSLRDNQPGLYQAPNLPPEAEAAGGIDLFIPEAYAVGNSRRDANIPGDPRAARRQRGLELALLDRSPMVIPSLQFEEDRSREALVAGPAALLAAKLIKVDERFRGDPARVEPKDLLDIYRLLSSYDTTSLAQTLEFCRQHAVAESIVHEAAECLRANFVGLQARGLRTLEEYLALHPAKLAVTEATRLLAEELLAALSLT